MNLVRDFKQFLLRGNVVEVAVAIVVGSAFVAVINALVRDILTPIVAAIVGRPDFSQLNFTIHNSRFLYGDLLNFVIAFVSVATVVFFFVVVPMNHVLARYSKEPSPDPTMRKCPECLSEIPVEAHRCRFCTAPVTPTES